MICYLERYFIKSVSFQVPLSITCETLSESINDMAARGRIDSNKLIHQALHNAVVLALDIDVLKRASLDFTESFVKVNLLLYYCM